MRRLVAFFAFAVALIPRSARADSAGDLEALLSESVVTTPSKTAQSASVAPATTSIVTADDLRRYGIRTLDEAINFLSLGMVTTEPQHAVEVGSRGVLFTTDYGNHVLLLVDGHSLNEPWDGTAYFERGAGIPIELVDHIEITLGPGSVLYGSQAMLGVINVVTKSAGDYGGVHLITEGELSAGADRSGSPSGLGGGYRLGAGVGKESTWLGLPVSGVLQIEYYRQKGAPFEYAPQSGNVDSVTGLPKDYGPRTAPGTWGGTVKDAYFTEAPAAYGRFRLGDFEVLARTGMYRRGTPYQDSIVAGFGDFDEPRSFERDRWINVEAQQRITLSKVTTLRSRLYGDLNEYHWENVSSGAEDCPEGATRGCRRSLTGTGRTLGTETNVTFDWLSNGRLTTLTGADVKMRDVRTWNDVIDGATGAPLDGNEATVRTDVAFAAYVEQAALPTSFLSLNAGLRADDDPRFGGKLSPRGAVGVTPWSGGQFKAIYSEAFRAPAVYELEYHDPADTVTAPNLRPETVRSVELSFEERFATQRFLFGVFRTWWNDMVLSAALSDAEVQSAIGAGQLAPGATEAYQYRNVATVDNYGYNASWEGSAFERRLSFGANFTEAYSRRNQGDGSPLEPLTVGPAAFGNARVAYDLGEKLPTLALAAQFQARRPADRAFDGGFSVSPHAPPALLLRGTVSGRVPGVRGLTYRLSAAYSFAAQGPYVVGPNQYAADESTRAALSPLTRISGFLGFEYVFGPR